MGFFKLLSSIASPPKEESTTLFERVVLHGLLGAKEVWNPRYDDPLEAGLMERFAGLCRKAGIQHVPKVLIYEGQKPNAASLLNGTVVIDRHFIEKMPPREVDAILGHELTHHRRRWFVFPISFGIELGVFAGLLYGLRRWVSPHVLNAQSMSNSKLARFFYKTGEVLAAFVATMQIAPFFTAPHSRYEEYKADQGGAKLTNPKDMADSLESLKEIIRPAEAAIAARRPAWERQAEAFVESITPAELRRGINHLRSSHPPTAERIARLRAMQAASTEVDSADASNTIHR